MQSFIRSVIRTLPSHGRTSARLFLRPRNYSVLSNPSATTSLSFNHPRIGRITNYVNTRQNIHPGRSQSRTLFIQTEATPNADSIKFKPGHQVLPSTQTIEFHSITATHSSPLARTLFRIPGIQSVLYGPDFITITKDSETTWNHIKPDIYGAITDHFTSGASLFNSDAEMSVPSDTMIQPGDDETVVMIKELLESRIRPTIQEDGGDIEYMGFENGIVKLKLKGACRTCDSSVVTLKNGIENMLKFYIEDVEGVEQVLEEHEELAKKEFEKVISVLLNS